MFSSPIYGFKVFLVSLILCVPSSVIIHLSVYWSVDFRFFSHSFVSAVRNTLGVLAISAFFGLFKSLLTSAIALMVKPFLRWRVIIISTIVLTLSEGWLYYKFLTWPFPFS